MSLIKYFKKPMKLRS